MRTITRIILHCSATRCTQSYTEEQLERDHKQRGFKKAGYHFYIRRDGTIYRPRLLGEVGAHCKGWNGQSIGICSSCRTLSASSAVCFPMPSWWVIGI